MILNPHATIGSGWEGALAWRQEERGSAAGVGQWWGTLPQGPWTTAIVAEVRWATLLSVNCPRVRLHARGPSNEDVCLALLI